MSLKDPDDDYDELVPHGNDFLGKLAGKAKPKLIFLIIGIVLGLFIHYYLINPFIIADSQQISKDCLNSKLILNKENECLYTLVPEPKSAGEKCASNNFYDLNFDKQIAPSSSNETPLLMPNNTTSEYSSFQLYYYSSAEVASEKIQIDGNKLTHEYLDTNKVAEKCVNWVKQSPCWTEEDLIKKSKRLTLTEMNSLYETIIQYSFFDLNEYYGPTNEDGTKANARCYSHELNISFKTNEKDTIFCDRPVPPESGPMPTPFRKVLEKIQELAN